MVAAGLITLSGAMAGLPAMAALAAAVASHKAIGLTGALLAGGTAGLDLSFLMGKVLNTTKIA
jgi:hypothetical protein